MRHDVPLTASLRQSPHSLSGTHRAQMALVLAEGRLEDALGPGSKALELDKSVRTYTAFAAAHVMAACAMACRARSEEQKLAAGMSASTDPSKDAGSSRAGAMWRIMEAGRHLAAGAALEASTASSRRSEVWE